MAETPLSRGLRPRTPRRPLVHLAVWMLRSSRRTTPLPCLSWRTFKTRVRATRRRLVMCRLGNKLADGAATSRRRLQIRLLLDRPAPITFTVQCSSLPCKRPRCRNADAVHPLKSWQTRWVTSASISSDRLRACHSFLIGQMEPPGDILKRNWILRHEENGPDQLRLALRVRLGHSWDLLPCRPRQGTRASVPDIMS